MVRRQHGNSQEHITKHIFVTGGVVSSLGKGLTASSLGRLLRSRGIHVLQQKLDPYINVDPGTMNPFQHGEVYVTEDGAETDLDIGHYERFLDVFLSQKANVTTGQIYQEVLRKERAGEYLGQCVQVIPHITNEIKSRMRAQASDDVDVIITEIGGNPSRSWRRPVRCVATSAPRTACSCTSPWCPTSPPRTSSRPSRPSTP